MCPFKVMATTVSCKKPFILGLGSSAPCLGAMTLQHHTRAFGHPAAGSGMQLPGKKAMASRWERYRL